MEFITASLEMFPKSEELAIAGVNLALSNNDLNKAEEFFNAAAEVSPKNKVLFSNMGSIYLTAADKAYNERSEEHTSELQSRPHLVCRLLLEKKKKRYKQNP